MIKRNDVAKKEVELQRLKMVLEQNMITPATSRRTVRRHRKDSLREGDRPDRPHLPYKNKPKPEDIFDDRHLPSAELRKID